LSPKNRLGIYQKIPDKTLKNPKANRAIEAKKQKQNKKLKLIDSKIEKYDQNLLIEKAKIEPSLFSVRQTSPRN
jgi:hypothetical protein